MNDGSPTHYSSSNGSLSNIDLSICDPLLYLDFNWKVDDDLHGSDHFPIILSANLAQEETECHMFKFSCANWPMFLELTNSQLVAEAVMGSDDPVNTFTDILIHCAKQSIPTRSTEVRPPKNPWFDEECKQLRRARKRAQEKAVSAPTAENLHEYKRQRARCRYTFRNKKKQSWQHFCSTLNIKTSSRKVWKTIGRMKRKSTRFPVQALKKDSNIITDKKAVANLLAETISFNSSSEHYSSDFQREKSRRESKPCNFSSDNQEDYNIPFSMQELKTALLKSNNSAPGPDSIHYQLLTHLSDKSLTLLLDIFNSIWTGGSFPPSWREATVIPIPKPGKDHSDPGNYRPIALTSCLCKTMERMVYDRLYWQLEAVGGLAATQCGFRKQRSTVDHLVRLESYIRNAFINKEHVVAVLFDLEKAYDTTWKHGILQDLEGLGFRGHLPVFIFNFLTDRVFRIRVGSTLSDSYDQEMGVPQGSILSPLLFNLKINNIVKEVHKGIEDALFVDDFTICTKGKTLAGVERRLQLCINNIQKWVSENGFKFSIAKTESIHFHNQRGLFPPPSLFLNNNPIKSSTQVKFLGIIFDQKLSFLPHIKYLKASCLKALNILKVVGSSNWGADQRTLLQLYRSFVRSKLDYGSVVYGGARRSYLKALDPIHHQGLRIALGAFRTSPIESLYALTGELPLELRRLRLAMNYYLKIKSTPESPVYDCILNSQFLMKYECTPSAIRPFGLRVVEHFEKAGINLDTVSDLPLATESPPWLLVPPDADLSLTSFKKHVTTEQLFISEFLQLSSSKYKDFTHIYTDGSKQEEKVAAAAVTGHSFKSIFDVRLPDHSSIFSAELRAIHLALKLVYQRKGDKFLIISDSLSAIQAITSMKLSHPLLPDILGLYSSMARQGKIIVFLWVPSHVGIRGNTAVDTAAKDALGLEPSDTHPYVPYTDYKRLVGKYVSNLWQEQWSQQKDNKLYQIMPSLSDSPPRSASGRKAETVLNRLLIGHTYFSHSFLLRNDDPPWCHACDEIMSVKHILTQCADLIEARERYFNGLTSIREVFDLPSTSIFLFLQEVGLLNKV
jgi:ribonuclease HI